MALTDYLSILRGAYGPPDYSSTSDPYLKQASQWAYSNNLANINSLASSLAAQEQQRQNAIDALNRQYGYYQEQLGSDTNQNLRNTISFLNGRGLFDSGITRGKVTGIYDRYKAALAQQANENQAHIANLLSQGQVSLQDALNQARAFQQSNQSWAEQRANSLKQQALENSMAEAGLTGLYQGNPTLAAKQQALENSMAEAGLTGLYQGKPTLPGLISQGQLTGAYTPPSGYPAPTIGPSTPASPVPSGGSPSVRDIQTALNRFGYHLAVDGIIGKHTRAAIVAFQRAHGLAPDGIVGPKTRAVLGI